MEAQRLCDVLDREFKDKEYLVANTYGLADMIVFPWVQQLRTGYENKTGLFAKDFLDMAQYKNLSRWADQVLARLEFREDWKFVAGATKSLAPNPG